jgi:DNA-binding NarL/FixJ family response regulator
VRVVIADDNLLVRAGVAALLREAGLAVAAEAATAEDLVRAVEAHAPDVAIVDVRMPPTQTDEGLRAASEIRARHPAIAIVVLSEHVEFGVAMRVLAESPERLGYLLKQRVADVDEFVSTLRRVAAGGTALDPRVVSGLLTARRDDGPLRDLTPREGEVLQLVAEGLSNQAIADRMVITLRSAEKYVSSIFVKLGLPDTGGEHRRVLAVLRLLRAQPNPPPPVDRPLRATGTPPA